MLSVTMRTQDAVTWRIRRTRLPLVRRRCLSNCGSETTTASGSFRANANGKAIDIWLLLLCTQCGRTSKVTVIERSASIDPGLLRRYENNDSDLVAEVLVDPAIARRNRFTPDWEDSWEIISTHEMQDQDYPLSVHVEFIDPIPLRPAHVLSMGLSLSRNKIKQMVDSDLITLPLKPGTKTCTPFEFKIMSSMHELP